MKGKKIAIRTSDNLKEIEYTHIQTSSKSICFMFSGTGYTYDKPLASFSKVIETLKEMVQHHMQK